MLVLTRKSGEQIRIADDITITVLRIQGNSIRIGIEAPRSVPVVRAELPPREAIDSAPQPHVAPPAELSAPLSEPPCCKTPPADASPAESPLPPGPLSPRVVQRRSHLHDRRSRPQARHTPRASGFSPVSPTATSARAVPLC